jgi:hypothetical protein
MAESCVVEYFKEKVSSSKSESVLFLTEDFERLFSYIEFLQNYYNKPQTEEVEEKEDSVIKQAFWDKRLKYSKYNYLTIVDGWLWYWHEGQKWWVTLKDANCLSLDDFESDPDMELVDRIKLPKFYSKT